MIERSTWLLMILILLCCVVIKPTKAQNKGYLATFPTSVVPGSEVPFCIRFFDVAEDVVLKIEDDSPQLFEPFKKTIKSTQETCLMIQIKKNVIVDAFSKSLTINGETVDGSYKFNNTKMFFYKKTSSLTFIETDKPVYKPGQIVKVRILSIDYELAPMDRIFQEVYVQDGSETRLFQWLNLKSNTGLVTLELPIADEPNFGIWKITVKENLKKDPVAVANFEVKKYVLPKFELQLQTPSHVLINDKEITFTACAKYSYGKNVKGELDIKFYLTKYYAVLTANATPKLSQKRKIKGCEKITIALEKLGIPSPAYEDTIYIRADFKEDDTDLKANADAKAVVLYRQYKIELSEPKYYKPGLPTKMRIRITTPDYKPVVGKTLTIKVKELNVLIFEKAFESDEDGFISVYFTSTACTDQASCKKGALLYIQVEVEEKLPNHKDHYKQLQPSSTAFSLQPWHSKQNTYLQIYRPESLKPIDCNETANFYIKLRSNNNIQGKIHFQLQSKSNIVYAGSYNIDSNEKMISVGANRDEILIEKIKSQKKRDVINAISPCELPLDEGIQIDELEDEDNGPSTNWYYDKTSGQCLKFFYKGNGGNRNNFESEAECLENCGLRASSLKQKRVSNIEFKNEFEKNDDPLLTTLLMSVPINDALSPEFHLLVFYVVNGEVIPDSTTLTVSKCLKNKVKLSLSESSIKTGENIKINLSGAPNSLCTLSAVDKSVTFMGKTNTIDLDKVFDDLAAFRLDMDYFNIYPDTELCDYGSKIPLAKRSLVYPSHGYGRVIHDAVEAFKRSGLLHFTDLTVYKQRTCFIGRASNKFGPLEFSSSVSNNVEVAPVPDAPIPTSATNVVRDFFPETWLWDIEILNEDGLKELTKKAPDSITDWIFNSYCLSKEHSIGIAAPATLNVFQPFFVSVNLPYSVVKGEILPVQASVFNYLNKCIPVIIQFFPEKRISPVDITESSVKRCVCPDDKVSHVFQARALEFDTQAGVNVTVKVTALQQTNICPESAGEIAKLSYSDSETRQVLVEPEGIKNEVSKNLFVYLNGNATDEEFQITLPKNLVSRSARAFLTVIGDPMGQAMDNLEHLVALPTGCGEQNMVRFAPLVAVTKYLQETSQLTTKISELAKDYLKIGYQRQLTYRHPDGSYSAFGKSDQAGGSTWLTAFVLRCFSQSFELEQVKIDQDDINKSFNWLLNKQSSDGSFQSVGTLLSKALSGGLGDNKKVGLSAYVLISLLSSIKQTKIENYDKAKINRGLLYLQKAVYSFDEMDTYTLALSLYAFKLSEQYKAAIIEIEHELDTRAVVEGDFKFWKQENSGDNTNYKPQSADIEITAYVLLAKLYKSSKENVANILPIVKWLNLQRNSLGGFYSTQDTVVALDALSRFARDYYFKRTYLRVAYSFNRGNSKPIIVNSQNRLLSQKHQLTPFSENTTNTLKLNVNGTGSGLVQLSVRYNIKKEIKSKKDFDMKIQTTSNGECKSVTLEIKTNYKGDGEASSMAIVHLRLPSGWVPVENTVSDLAKDDNIRLKRHEINENKLALYFDEISKKGKTIKFEITKLFDIKNVKPGVISVYDYYESQDDSHNQEFQLPCQ